MNEKPAIRIMVVDDHDIVREGLELLLNQPGDLEVVASVGGGREAVKILQILDPREESMAKRMRPRRKRKPE